MFKSSSEIFSFLPFYTWLLTMSFLTVWKSVKLNSFVDNLLCRMVDWLGINLLIRVLHEDQSFCNCIYRRDKSRLRKLPRFPVLLWQPLATRTLMLQTHKAGQILMLHFRTNSVLGLTQNITFKAAISPACLTVPVIG